MAEVLLSIQSTFERACWADIKVKPEVISVVLGGIGVRGGRYLET